jgi:lipopolysaccharide/colanic/teichoic acid biosynthesis glycosyltransferase
MQNGIPRSVEIVLALGGLVISSPLLFLAAVLIKATSPGAILFRQQRVGRFGKVFEIFKFRSMRLENAGAQVTAKGDSRVTRVRECARAGWREGVRAGGHGVSSISDYVAI